MVVKVGWLSWRTKYEVLVITGNIEQLFLGFFCYTFIQDDLKKSIWDFLLGLVWDFPSYEVLHYLYIVRHPRQKITLGCCYVCLNMSGIYEQNRTNKPYTAVRSNLSSSNSSWCRYCHLHQLPTAQHTNYRHNHYQYRECEWADCCPAPSSDHCAFQISNLVLLREIFSMVDFVWNSTFSSLTAPNNHQSLGSDHFWMIKFIRNYMKSDSVQESWSLSTASRGDSEMILDTIQPYIMSL